MVAGWVLRALMVEFLVLINMSTTDVSVWVNLVYLLFQRPLFVAGVAISILPFLLQTPVLRPLADFMASRMWYPFARLTYGAYLSHGVFMIFRAYDTQKGVFANEFDAFLFFFAYLLFAFVFSLLSTVLVGMPSQRLIDEFCFKSKNALANLISAKFRSFAS